MRIYITFLVLALAACTPQLQQKVKQEQADQARYDAQAHANARAQACSKTAIPGTLDHMHCMLGTGDTQAPAHP